MLPFSEYVTRQVRERNEDEQYLKQKLEQKDHDLEAAERKVKDLQLRLKRFVKDDQAKDERILQMEKENRDLTDKMNSLTEMLDQNRNQQHGKASANGNANGQTQVRNQKNSSTCVIL